jgi:hypothetical protein
MVGASFKELMENTNCYEFVLEGFFGGTDETDHLIKWVQCPEEYLPFVKNFFQEHAGNVQEVQPLSKEVVSERDMDLVIRPNALKGLALNHRVADAPLPDKPGYSLPPIKQ